MSSTTHDEWTVHVGMVGDTGRWWRGVWGKKDVSVVEPSEESLKTFVDHLVDSVIGGELYLTDFSTEKGAKIQLTFGPTSAKPVSMALVEIEPAEAAAYATNVFLEVALQAQSRKCRLHPSAFTSTSVTSTKPLTGHSRESNFDPKGGQKTIEDAEKEETCGRSDPSKMKTRGRSMKYEGHDEGIKEEKEMSKKLFASREKTSTKPKAAARPLSSSLANPNNKARRIQAIEFESDDD